MPRKAYSVCQRIRRHGGGECKYSVRTYDYLQGQEIIYNKRGIGYFVSAGAKDRIITLRKDIFLHEELPEFFRQVSALDIPIKEIEKMYKEYLTQQ